MVIICSIMAVALFLYGAFLMYDNGVIASTLEEAKVKIHVLAINQFSGIALIALSAAMAVALMFKLN